MFKQINLAGLIAGLILCSLFALAGCKTTPTANQQTGIDLAVNAGVAVLIQRGTDSPTVWKERAAKTIAIVNQLEAVAGTDSASLATVMAALSPLLDKAGLQAAERIAANQLIAVLTAEVKRRIDPASPEVVQVRHVLDLVKTAASYYQ